jgi:hypothetical protein
VLSFPTVEETLNHPAYPSTVWDLQPDRKGKASVAKDRGGPVELAWELHGTGPIKMIVSITFFLRSINL